MDNDYLNNGTILVLEEFGIVLDLEWTIDRIMLLIAAAQKKRDLRKTSS